MDSNWDDWYLQLRTYLEAKGWLITFEHPTGPGTAGFDLEINKKIYHKLLALCRKGTAATYVTKAANFNGWEAARFLLDCYEGFSKQCQRSLRQLIETIRHVHGTNMSKHIDKFERTCGQMAHNNPGKTPTDEQKVEWFLDSVTKKTYDSVYSTCTDKLLDGDLSFAKTIKLYTHRCFQKYPHFQLDDLETESKKTVSNNYTSFAQPKGKGKGKGRGRAFQREAGKGRGRPHNCRSPSNQKGKGRAPDKGSNTRDKGKSQRHHSGTRSTTLKDKCSYCDKDGHNARDCYKRQNDENKSKGNPKLTQANLNIEIEEHALMFSNAVLSTTLSEQPLNHPNEDISHWGETTNDNQTTGNEEDKDNQSEEGNDSGEEYEAYKEDPWYQPQEFPHEQAMEAETKVPVNDQQLPDQAPPSNEEQRIDQRDQCIKEKCNDDLPLGGDSRNPKPRETPQASDFTLANETLVSTSAENIEPALPNEPENNSLERSTGTPPLDQGILSRTHPYY